MFGQNEVANRRLKFEESIANLGPVEQKKLKDLFQLNENLIQQEERLNQIKEKINLKMSMADPQYWLYKSLNLMYNFINTPEPSRNMNSTFDFLSKLDKRRNLSSKNVFPMLYNL